MDARRVDSTGDAAMAGAGTDAWVGARAIRSADRRGNAVRAAFDLIVIAGSVATAHLSTGFTLDQHEERAMRRRGITYDTGFFPGGKTSREPFDSDVVRRELQVVADDLHCIVVRITGGDPERPRWPPDMRPTWGWRCGSRNFRAR